MADETPNLYILTSTDGIRITYTPSDSNGKPDLNYVDSARNLSFNGAEVGIQESPLGSLVTVVIRRTVDTGSTTLTLLVPAVHLGTTTSQPLTTVGVITENRTFLVLPNEGQRQFYSTINLQGVAQLI